MIDEVLQQIARNIIAGFLLTLGITSSEDEDTLEVKDYGPHRIFTQQVRVPDSMAAAIDPGETLDKLVSYMGHHNSLPTAVRFQAYDVETYVCPCGCGTFLYASIYHTA